MPFNTYERFGLPNTELERLRHEKFQHPNFVSLSLLNRENLADKKLLDIGSGADKRIAEFVSQEGGVFYSLDINPALQVDLKKSLEASGMSFFGVRANVRADFPFADKSFDIAHQRLVLMHLSEKDRAHDIAEALRVAKEKAIFVELSWRNMRSETHPVLVEEFKNTVYSFFDRSQPPVNAFMGEVLAMEVDAVARGSGEWGEESSEKFGREAGTYGAELIALAQTFASLTRKFYMDEQIAGSFDEFARSINALGERLVFVPPDIYAVVLKRRKASI